MPPPEEHPLLSELNDAQREAVVSPHTRLLVLAGAGSGKTKTLIQKIAYLIEKGADPAGILAITFTKNAAYEMIDRLILFADKGGEYAKVANDKTMSQEAKEEKRRMYLKKYPWLSNITISTFHSFCYKLLRRYGSQTFDNRFRILADSVHEDEFGQGLQAPESPKEIIQKLIKHRGESAEYLLKLKRYILDYYVDVRRRKAQKEEYAEYSKPYTTLGGEQVRSKSERYIADWLYIHNVKYLYEPSVMFKDFPFRPDFYIPQADAYLEHVSNLSHGMKEKEEQFHVANKLLIKTYEPMTKNIGAFYEALARSILPRISESIQRDIALNVESEFKAYFKQLDEFVSMVLSVMGKIKIEDKNMEKIFTRAAADQHDRVRIFYELAKPLLEEYRAYCTKRSYADFNDLLTMAVDLLEKNEGVRDVCRGQYSSVLVDEFQDVNALQMKLLHCLLTEKSQLLCVGDDWQSIYGWRGSEVDYIVNFKKYFEPADIVKLGINYRSSDTIVKASNEVIKKNAYKIEKEISALKKEGKKIYLYCSQKEGEDGVMAVATAIRKFLDVGYRKEDLLVLYRRSVAIEPYREVLRNHATLRTIHAAKGLEAKAVFIVGLTGGIHGFPQVWESDRILQIVKPGNIKLLMEEERRLFYVALTRAKEELFLVTELGNESSFIKEIPADLVERSTFFSLDTVQAETRCKSCSREISPEFSYCPYCSQKI